MLLRNRSIGWRGAEWEMERMLRRLVVWVGLLLPVAAGAAIQGWGMDESDLSWSDFDKYRSLVLPEAAELEWKKINWESQLAAGVLRAGQEGKPILIWAMNGHPLGCT
jgi:hypothetical protein